MLWVYGLNAFYFAWQRLLDSSLGLAGCLTRTPFHDSGQQKLFLYISGMRDPDPDHDGFNSRSLILE